MKYADTIYGGPVSPKISGIYLIRNKTSNSLYVGQSSNISNRWRNHKWMLQANKHNNIHLQRAWNKDSLDSFEFTILYICEPNIELTQQLKDIIAVQ